jgi:hypothetical protein
MQVLAANVGDSTPAIGGKLCAADELLEFKMTPDRRCGAMSDSTSERPVGRSVSLARGERLAAGASVLTQPHVRSSGDDQRVLPFSAEDLAALPVDERALLVLQELVNTEQWNEHNYLNGYDRNPAGRPVAEAMAWLRGNAFVARTPGATPDSIFVTSAGTRRWSRASRLCVPRVASSMTCTR